MNTMPFDRRPLKISITCFQAPFIPNLPNLTELWHKGTLPNPGHVPGLSIVEPRLDLTHDDRFPENPLF